MSADATSFTTILYAVSDDGVARVTLNRPQAFNAFTGDMLQELAQAFRAATQDARVRAVVVTGAGRAFCAGQDLRANPDALKALKPWLETMYRPMLQALAAVKVPTVAAVNGIAAGAGFSLTLACDYRIASTAAKFVSAFGKIGLVPDCGMSHFLPRLVGLGRAMEIIGLNRDLTGEEALEWGLAHRVCAPEELEQVTQAFAGQLAQVSPLAFSLTRELLARSPSSTIAEALTLEEQCQGKAGASADFQEGLAAFEARRPAKFSGK